MIGIAGSLALLLLVGITLAISLPELIDQFPSSLLVNAAEGGWQAAPLPQDDLTTVDPTVATQALSSNSSGELPSSGYLVLDCTEQEQRIRESSLLGYNFGSSTYTFEQAFLDYQLDFSMDVDLDQGSIQMEQGLLEVWRWQDYNPEQDPPEWEVILNTREGLAAQGSFVENGWISGKFNSIRTMWGPEEEEGDPEIDSNDFYGFIDEGSREVTICLLAVGVNRDEGNQSADLTQLQAAGKGSLIDNWWSPRQCYTCQITGSQP